MYKNDLHTSTVDGAAAYERARAKTELIEETKETDKRSEEDGDDDYCGCSDPGCPCGGSKKGSL